MEEIKNKLAKKILIILVTIIIISNSIIPNYTYASVGEDLFNSIFYLVAKLGDIAIQLMQHMTIGTGNIKDENGDDYAIKYSPGIIFSNKVLLLDINFLNPNKSEIKRRDTTKYYGTVSDDNGSLQYKTEKFDTLGEVKNDIITYLAENDFLNSIENNFNISEEKYIERGGYGIRIGKDENENYYYDITEIIDGSPVYWDALGGFIFDSIPSLREGLGQTLIDRIRGGRRKRKV